MTRTNRTETRHSPGARSLAVAAVLAFVLALGAAGPASAQDPVSAQYDTSVSHVSGVSSSSGEESGLQESLVGGLPFTGLDLIALGAVALALASIGFALRRLSAHPGD